MPVDTLLLDADGVIQTRPPGWRDALAERLGFRGEPAAFLADVFAAERSALDGRARFTDALPALLRRWECRATLERALEVWTMIEVDREVLETVAVLRRKGVACHLASNQEAYKARYMSQVLGYRDLFDGEFYSCRLGLAKPDGAYFRAILDRLGGRAGRALFVDDAPANVESARAAGLHAAEFPHAAGARELLRILDAFGLHVRL